VISWNLRTHIKKNKLINGQVYDVGPWFLYCLYILCIIWCACGALGKLRVVTKTGRSEKKSSELETYNIYYYIYIYVYIMTSRLSKQNHLSRADDNPERDYIQCLYKETFCRVFTVMSNPRVCFMVVYSSTGLYHIVQSPTNRVSYDSSSRFLSSMYITV